MHIAALGTGCVRDFSYSVITDCASVEPNSDSKPTVSILKDCKGQLRSARIVNHCGMLGLVLFPEAAMCRRFAWLYILLVAIAFATLLMLRVRLELNYGELHLGIPATVQTQGVEVFAKHLNGQLVPLVRREEDARLFSQLACSGPCSSLVITVPDSANFVPTDLEVRFGEHWGAPSIALPFSTEKTSDVAIRGGIPMKTWELTPRTVSSNYTWGVRSACNWQGDIWLFVVPLLQVLLGFSVAKFFGKVGWQYFFAGRGEVLVVPPTGVDLESLPLTGWLFSCVRYFFLLLISGQVWALLPGFVFVRWGNQFLALVVVVLGFGGLSHVYVRAVLRTADDSVRWKLAAFLLLFVVVVKLWFCWRFDAVQRGDYERYYRYGVAMATGDWGLIGDRAVLTRVAFLERSLVFTAPLISLFGKSLTVLELAALGIEILTVVLTMWLVTRMFSATVGCLTLPFLLFYPPFVFGTWVVGTTTPGFLVMLLVWCAMQKLYEYFRFNLVTGKNGNVLSGWLLPTLVFCAALTLLELLRVAGVFVYASAFVCSITGVLCLRRAGFVSSGSRSLRLMFLLALTIYLGFVSVRTGRNMVLSVIRRHVETGPSISLLSSLSAMDSATNGSGGTISNWRFATLLNVPPNVRFELNWRKLLHEKLLVGVDAWLHPLRKNAYLALLQDFQNRVLGGVHGAREGFMSWTRVPWYSTLRLLTDGICLLLLMLTGMRVLGAYRLGVTRAELFPLCFVVLQYSAIVLLLEAGPYYSQILAFPLAWSSAGVLAIALKPSEYGVQAAGHTMLATLNWTGLMTGLRRPAVVLLVTGIVLGGHLALGSWLQGRGLGFLGLYSSSVPPADGISGLTSSSRVHVSTGMRTVGGKIAAGSEVQGTVVIPQAFRRGPLVCFLLTADARSRDLYFPREFWRKLPIEYSISLNGQFFRRGRLGDLHPPHMLCIAADEVPAVAGGDLQISVSLRSLESVNTRELGFLPAVAVEYPFNPSFDPRADLKKWYDAIAGTNADAGSAQQ